MNKEQKSSNYATRKICIKDCFSGKTNNIIAKKMAEKIFQYNAKNIKAGV